MGGRPFSRGKGRHVRLVSEINVTPFVDVMLVLLVIFMVTAPLMVTGVQVDLPKTETAPIPQDDEPLTVSINKKGEIILQKTIVKPAVLAAKLQAIHKSKKDSRIFIRADKKLDYGKVMEVVSIIQGAGYRKIALITEQPAQEAAP
ncbi:MAG: protein TolR [Hyphomicrobiales bacterium]|nr:protein TolR [Hyphomicrobiales bacterium]